MIKYRAIFLVLFAVSVYLTSCNRKKKGCVDVNAVNYCSKCNHSDGSCEYDITIGFWFDSLFYKNVLLFNQVDTFKVYLADNHGMNRYIGIYTKNQVFANEPSCDNSSLLKVNIRYNKSDLKDNCKNGGLFGGSNRCWFLVGRAELIKNGQTNGVAESSLTIYYSSSYGCKLIKF